MARQRHEAKSDRSVLVAIVAIVAIIAVFVFFQSNTLQEQANVAGEGPRVIDKSRTSAAGLLVQPVPAPSTGECDRILNLIPKPGTDFPTEYKISDFSDIPYHSQQTRYGAIGATLKMLVDYYQPLNTLTQEAIAKEVGANELHYISRSTTRDNTYQFLTETLKRPYETYYPLGALLTTSGAYTLDQAADLIRLCPEIKEAVVVPMLKQQLYETDKPVYARLMVEPSSNRGGGVLYPLTSRELAYLDVAGQPVIFLGYDTNGFILHDPWPKESWSGRFGGAYQHLSYADIKKYALLTVDSSLGNSFAEPIAITAMPQGNSGGKYAVSIGYISLKGGIVFPSFENVEVTLQIPQAGYTETKRIVTINRGETKSAEFGLPLISGNYAAKIKITGTRRNPSIPDFRFQAESIRFDVEKEYTIQVSG